MNIRLTRESNLPFYQQIVDQVRAALASGELAPGQKLWTIHGLAKELKVNPNTVARAYRELEAAGIVVARGALGTCIAAETDTSLAERERMRILRERGEAFAEAVVELNVSSDEAVQLIREMIELKRGRQEEG